MEVFPLAKTDLGPAAKTLVKKIASATGALYAPLSTILKARADVTAAAIKAEGEIEVELVRRRALERLAAEETKKQNNLEAIYGQTFQLLDSETDIGTIEQMEEDWIVFHSEKARLVSDEEMRTLWARVMASEAETPGSYSKRSLDTLSILEKREAHLFTLVCRFNVQVNSESIPVVFFHDGRPTMPSIYTDPGLNKDALIHLSTIGLLHYTSPFLTSHIREYDSPVLDVKYFGEHRMFKMLKAEPPSTRYSINYGAVGLTKVGQELAKISGAEPVQGFFDFLEGRWALRTTSRVADPKQ